MKKVIGAIIIILILAIISIILVMVFGSRKGIQPLEVKVITDKIGYKIGDSLKVKIENNLEKEVCFSECYPYYLEKKGKTWESYNYVACFTANLVDSCVASKAVKAFELISPSIKKGLHRIAVPVCIGCKGGESFKENQRFYSNEFIIK